MRKRVLEFFVFFMTLLILGLKMLLLIPLLIFLAYQDIQLLYEILNDLMSGAVSFDLHHPADSK